MVYRLLKHTGRCFGLLAFPILMTACAYTSRWTPDSVAPPASLKIATEKVKQEHKEQEAKDAQVQQDQAGPISITRDGAILSALSQNHSLAVERFSPKIASTRITEARAAFDPNLLATTSYGRSSSSGGKAEGDSQVSRSFQTDMSVSEYFPTGTEVFLSGGFSRSRPSSSDWGYSGSWSVGVNQALLEGAGLEVNRVALHKAEISNAISRHEFRGFVMDLVQQVENAYWDLVLANETLEIRLFAVHLAEEQLGLNRDMIEVGKLSADAEISAEAELASRRVDLVDAEAAVKTRTIQLIRLLNPERENQWKTVFQPADEAETQAIDLNPDISAKLADLYRPELAQSRLDLTNRDLEVVQTKNGLLPNLDAFASFGRISSGNSSGDAIRYFDDSDFDNYEVGLSFKMAPLNRAEKAAYRRSRFEQQQAEIALLNLEQSVESEVRTAVIETQKQWERIFATRQVIKSREEELKVEQERFRVGKSTNLDVLQVHRDLIQAQLNEVTARVQYIESLTSLYLKEGTLLDRRGIDLNADGEMEK